MIQSSTHAEPGKINTAASVAIVLGNSGSLLDLPPQEQWPADLLVIGTNRILRAGQDGRTYHPDWLVISDGRALETEQEALKGYTGRLLLADWLGTDIPHEQFPAVPMRGSHRYKPIPHFHANQWDDPVWHIGSAPFQAAQLALRVLPVGGTVILLGCESRWPPRGDPRRSRHHFYSDRRIRAGSRPFQVNGKYTHQWGVLDKWARTKGFKVLEGSPWVDLRIGELEHMDFVSLCRGSKHTGS